MKTEKAKLKQSKLSQGLACHAVAKTNEGKQAELRHRTASENLKRRAHIA